MYPPLHFACAWNGACDLPGLEKQQAQWSVGPGIPWFAIKHSCGNGPGMVDVGVSVNIDQAACCVLTWKVLFVAGISLSRERLWQS